MNKRKYCNKHGYYHNDICPGCLAAAAPDLYKACITAEIELEQRYKANEGSSIDKLALKIIKAAIAKTKE